MPVYQPRERWFQLAAWQPGSLAAWQGEPEIEGIIVNAYFLYKQAEVRKALVANGSLKEFVNFPGLIATDSGAF